jgi:hypothetical protein
VLRQWNPEDQLVGALMHGSEAHAAPILELVPDSAIWRPDNRWVEIIRFLVADGCDPDPVLVLRTARHRPPADPASAGASRGRWDLPSLSPASVTTTSD